MKPMTPFVRLQGLETPTSERGRSLWRAAPRGIALFLGGFALLNLLGGMRSAHFDANLWWIDLRKLPEWIGQPLLLVSALCFLAFTVRPSAANWRRRLTLVCAVALGAVAVVNVGEFYTLLIRGSVTSHFPVPVSLMIAGVLAIIALANTRANFSAPVRGDALRALAIAFACVICFPLAQMLCFVKTDYRRPADAAVVLGARVYADGRPSDALADRVRTACQLYRDGLARKLIFSGGPGDGAIPESEAMRRMAIKLGVNASDIIVDDAGLNTQATVRHSEAMLSKNHSPRILVVSHFYHLPRIKLAFQRDGWEVYTVPAKETYLLRQTPYNMAREVAALWVYYLRPLASPQA